MTKFEEKINLNELKKYFRSYDLANLSDFIFSETISINDFKKKNENFFVIDKNEELVTYINPRVSLSDGDIVFSKTEYVRSLFKLLRSSSLKDLTLITHQSDIKIDKRLYSKKPKAISKWFSVNVSIEKEDLYSIPIGFANEHYKKNLNPEKLIKKNKDFKKINKIYINFNPNTNFFERKRILRTYIGNPNFVVSSSDLKMSKYKDDLEKYKYVICPPGNGIQTHRLWEAIYFGAIPIVKDAILYKNYKMLNILFVEDFKNLNISDFNNQETKAYQGYEEFFEDISIKIFDKKEKIEKNPQLFIISKKVLYNLKRKHNLVSKINKLYKPIRSKIFKILN